VVFARTFVGVTSLDTPAPNDLDAPVPARPMRSWNALRVIAAIAGVAVLVAASVFTLGLALLAPLGMLGARYVARRQKSAFTLGTSWLGASLFVALAMTIIGGVAVSQLPSRMFETIQHSADSASMAKRPPPPAWFERIAPGAAARARAAPTGPANLTRAFTIWAFVVGGVFTVTLFGAVIGTAGWLPGVLLAYAFSGRWIPRS
jgi:hypothetical protein